MTGPGLRRFVTPGPPDPSGTTRPGPGAAASPGPAASADGSSRPGPAGVTTTAARPAAAADPAEACDLCGAPAGTGHGHVADLERSALLCACRPCYLLFTHSQAGGGRYRAVPDRYLADPARPMSVTEWEDLQVPVGLAFFLRQSPGEDLTGFYPSPAGVTECRLDLGCWRRLTDAHPLLRAAEPDVEAVLIHRDGGQVETFVVPVDVCYELAGRLRLLWRGFDGGAEARDAIAEFLAAARSRARALDPET